MQIDTRLASSFESPCTVDSLALAACLMACDFPMLAEPQRIKVDGGQDRFIFNFAKRSNRGQGMTDALTAWDSSEARDSPIRDCRNWWENRKVLLGFSQRAFPAIYQQVFANFSARPRAGYTAIPAGLKSAGEIWTRDTNRVAAAFVLGVRCIKYRQELGDTWYCFERDAALEHFFTFFPTPDQFSSNLNMVRLWLVSAMAYNYKTLLAHVKESSKGWSVDVNDSVAIVSPHASDAVKKQVLEFLNL